LNAPRNFPIGVRFAATRAISVMVGLVLGIIGGDEDRTADSADGVQIHKEGMGRKVAQKAQL
jgi:hypothetical protein